MTVIINKLKFHDESYKFILEDCESDYLDNLGKLNIFIGQNNSGKSRLMRSILNNEQIEFYPTPKSVSILNPSFDKSEDIIKFFNECAQKIRDYDDIIIKSVLPKYFKDIKSFPPISFLKNNSNIIDEYDSFFNTIYKNLGKRTRINGKTVYPENWEDLLNHINESFENYDISTLNLIFNFKKVYIPILRGILPLNEDSTEFSDLYRDRVFFDYFENSEENLEIFTGLTIYEDIKRMLLGDYHQRESVKEFEEFLSDNFFSLEKVTLIPHLDEKGQNDVLYIKIGKEKERPIYNLGDGIQSIIILTFPLFKYMDDIKDNENVLYFIEEPELNLHPGLQRKLMETLINDERFNRFQFFVTTHSNHFLDLSIEYDDVSVFTFEKQLEDNEDIEANSSVIIKNRLDKSIFDLIDVKPSSLLYSNCSIWVEGKYDKYFFKHCLKLYKDKYSDFNYSEDYHYSFFIYNGSDIKQWSIFDEENTTDINNFFKDIFVIHDKDGETENILHEKLNNSLKDNYYILNVLELENLVKKEVLIKILEDYDCEFSQEFDEEDYKNIKLGNFLYENVLDKTECPGLIKLKNKGSDNEKPDLSKKKFNSKIINFSHTWDDLSDEAKTITCKIVKFIRESN